MARPAIRFGVSAVIVLALAACVAPPGMTTAPGAVAPAPPATSDQDFLNRAATGTGNEVSLGRLAERNGFTPTVRSFGAQIAAEHGRVQARLLALARRLGMVAYTTSSDLSQAAALSGPEFDRRFLADQIADQREALALFESEAETGQNLRLRRFAREWLPMLRRDLHQAEVIAARGGP